MVVESKPSLVFWFFLGLVFLIISTVAWVPMLLLVRQFIPGQQQWAASVLGAWLVPLVLLPKASSLVRTACWRVDLEGLESAAVGRIRFADVVSVCRGYPREQGVVLKMLQISLTADADGLTNDALVLRLANGRLLVLNLLSPSIHGGRAVMTKVQELLAGKPQVGYSPAEVKALKSRPVNKIIVRKGG